MQNLEKTKNQTEKVDTNSYNAAELVKRYITLSMHGDIHSQNGIGLLVELYRIAAGDCVKHEVTAILSKYNFEEILSQEELNFLSKHLSEVFALVTSPDSYIFPPFFTKAGQPQEVTDFMCKMASFPENITVYNPFAGVNFYAITLPNRVVGEENDKELWALGQIRLFANSIDKRADIVLADSFEKMNSNEKFAGIVTSPNPAYLHNNGKEIYDIVQMLYAKLADGGKLACTVSAGFLYSNVKKVRTVREELIRNKAIASVIMLPSEIFADSSVAQAVLLLTKGRENKEIHFGDASGHTRYAKNPYQATVLDLDSFKYAYDSDIEDTQEGYPATEDQTGIAIPYSDLVDTILTPEFYLTPRPEKGIALSELAEELPELQGEDISAEYVLTGSSIPKAQHGKPFTPTIVESDRTVTSKKCVHITDNVVILALVNGNIRTVYTEGFSGKIAFSSNTIKVLKPKVGLNAKYLAAFLTQKIVADQIKVHAFRDAIPYLNKVTLKHIFVPVYESIEEYEQLISNILSSDMLDLEAKYEETLNKHKREIGSTRHAMGQTLMALTANWIAFKNFAQKQENGIKLSDTIGRKNPISVYDLFETITYKISTLHQQIQYLKFDTDWGEDVAINPHKVIDKYISNNRDTLFKMVNDGNNITDILYDEGTDHNPEFYAPTKLVERIFDNIVSNARVHGFTTNSSNNIIRFDWKAETCGIVITIANNGVPLKSGVSGEDVLMSGFTTVLNKKESDTTTHSGHGGFEIKSLMDGLGCVEVISQPDAEFPVIYKLTFETTNY